jgi:hypothetical protein
MPSALDMGKRLGAKSLRQMAQDISLARAVALPKPLTLRAIMKLFAPLATPDPPKNLAYNPVFNEDAPVLPRPQARFQWVDSEPKTVRSATRYRCRLSLDYGSGIALIGPEDDFWTTDTNVIFQTVLDYDTTFRAAVLAANDWGASEWKYIEFTTYDNPNGGSNSGPGGNTPTVPHPSGLAFWNCDVTSVDSGVVEHQPVCFVLTDLTNGAKGHQVVQPGYNTGEGCGPGTSNPAFQLPTAGLPGLVKGHKYQWVVIKPADASCGDSSDPDSMAAVVATGTFILGSDPVLIVNWTNAG